MTLSESMRKQLFHTYTTWSQHDLGSQERLEEFLGGRLTLYPHTSVDISSPPTWDEDPLEDANWRFQYHSLVWLDRVREAALEVGNDDALGAYKRVLRSWVEDNPEHGAKSADAWFDMAVGLRVIVFAFALDQLGPEKWLLDAVRAHGEHLVRDENYDIRGNHGLHQDLGLVVAGQLLDRIDWIDYAAKRILAMFDEAIDHEGVCREGCVDYQYRNYRWYHEALTRLRAAGAKRVGGMAQRLSQMPEFLAHATNPQGEYVLIGDTLAHRAPRIEGTAADWVRDRSCAPRTTTRLYGSGYLFSRTAWRTAAEEPSTTLVTQRFGPGRSSAVHGHEDGGAITLDFGSETLLRDSGLYAYEGGVPRLYMRGRAAHNVIDVPGRHFYPSAPSELMAFEETESHVFTTMRTASIRGVTWHRTMCWVGDLHLLLVDDRVRLDSEDIIQQRWHLPEGSTVTTRQGQVDVATPRGNIMEIRRVGDDGPVSVTEGSRAPFDGWVSTEYRKLTAAPVMDFRLVAESARFSTAITYGMSDGVLPKVEKLDRRSKELRCVVQYQGSRRRILVTSDGVDMTEM